MSGTEPTTVLVGLDQPLAEHGCVALLVVARSANDPDLARFARGAHLGRSFAIVPLGGPPHLGYLTPMEREEAAATGLALLTPEALDAARLAVERPDPGQFLAGLLERGFAALGLAPGRVALAGHAAAGEVLAACQLLAGAGWSFTSGNPIVRRWRQRKTDWEVAAARRATTGTCAAMRRVAEILAAAVPRVGELWFQGERLTVGRLKLEVAVELARHGLEQPEGNLLAPAEEGAVPHNTGTPGRVLRPGQTLIVDLFPKGLLFADCTRTFCVGGAPPAVTEAFGAVRDALALAHREARPGRRGWDLQEAVCGLLGARGYPTPIGNPGTVRGYVHGLGHGVGYELHEYPAMTRQAGAEGVLGTGDLVTLEPGLYEPGEPGSGLGWAIRLEDHVVIGDEANENLTPLPYDLDPHAWLA